MLVFILSIPCFSMKKVLQSQITDPTRLWPPIYPSVPKVLMRYNTILIKYWSTVRLE